MSVAEAASRWGDVWGAAWRAVLYGLLWRVQWISAAPLLFSAVLLGGLAWWGWTPANEAVRQALDQWGWSQAALDWLDAMGWSSLRAALVPLLISLISIPVIIVVCLLAVGALAAPAMAKLVQQRRFVALVPQGQVPWWKSLGESFRPTAVAVLAFVLTLPLWLLPPVAGLVVPLVWGWLAYRVMTLDVLADWASEQELAALLKQHRGPLMFMGVASGYMGSMPAMLWAAGGVLSFALAPVLVLVSVWLYTLVFCLTGLWFAHYLMQALHQLRSRQVPVEGRAWLG